eukprot:gb/GECG01015147.1/.p1 GENE.gb/GECG01015147.1/~~gb/GECG01015147.1/.p1  ORF type:complete len:230 (+),score=37.57 gb/GECG01015147.1/:1-690(+)
MADQSQPVKPGNPREEVDYDPEKPDVRGKILSVWDMVLAAYVFVAGAYTLYEYIDESSEERQDDSWQIPVVGVLLCLFAIFFFAASLMFFRKVDRWLPFMYTYFGRGVFLMIAGVTSVNEDNQALKFLPIIPLATGAVYILISCASRVLIPLPLLRAATAIEAYVARHPGYKEHLAEHNRKKTENKWKKQYKKEMKEYQKRVQEQDKQKGQGAAPAQEHGEGDDSDAGA